MKREDPFQKWDAHDREQQGENATSPEAPQRIGPRPRMLQVAWIISTGMLVLGVLLIILILAGEGHRIGL